MADRLTIKLENALELGTLLKEIQEDFSDKDSKSILRFAVKQAMTPVLQAAQGDVPRDTGLLGNQLRVIPKKVTGRDRKSKYVTAGETIMGIVQTRPIPKKIKKQAAAHIKNMAAGKGKSKAYKAFIESKGFHYDARAIAMEFGFHHHASSEMGTAKNPGKPFLRQALERNIDTVLKSLADNFRMALKKYESKRVIK